MITYNKDEVKESLTDEDVFDILELIGAEPQLVNDHIECLTICHGGDSRKLYYYFNTQLFKCWTHCDETMDIFQLIMKVKNVDLNTAIYFVVQQANLTWKLKDIFDPIVEEDWKILKKYQDISNLQIKDKQKIALPEVDKKVIKHFPQPVIVPWMEEGISKEVCDYAGIRYNPIEGAIIIPHYDENNRLIGIRQRTLIKENEKYGKYRPARINGKLYNSPLGFNLFGLNWSKNNIEQAKTAIVVEAEKSVFKSMTFFGLQNNLCVAVCGSSISNYQFDLLLDCGIKELCIGFDKDFHELGDEDYKKLIIKLEKLGNKFSSKVNVSVLFDKFGVLGYKESPLDRTKDVFLLLWRNRIML